MARSRCELCPARPLKPHAPLHTLPVQPVDFGPLGALRDMRVLSLSECPRMRQLPPAVLGLTNLRVGAGCVHAACCSARQAGLNQNCRRRHEPFAVCRGF